MSQLGGTSLPAKHHIPSSVPTSLTGHINADDDIPPYFMMDYVAPDDLLMSNADNGEIRDFREWRKKRRRTRSITVRVTEDLRSAIEQYVIERNISISDFCNSAFTSFLRAEQRIMYELATKGLSDVAPETNLPEE